MDLCWQSNISAFEYAVRLVIAFLTRSKYLLISWLQSPSDLILELKEIVCYCFLCFPIYLPWSDGTRCHDLYFFDRAPTIRSPEASRSEFLDVFLHWGTGGDPWREGFMPGSPLYLRTSNLSCLLKGRRERGKYPLQPTYTWLRN